MKWVLGVVAVLFLLACTVQGPVCTAPYITNGNTCCLDRDANTICDVDENGSVIAAPEGLDCSLCPPNFVTQKEEVIVYKYVCMNGTVMDTSDECGDLVRSNADSFSLSKSQDNTLVKDFDLRPACRGEFRAAEMYLSLLKNVDKVVLQVKSNPVGGYDDLLELTVPSTGEKYAYLGFCRTAECGPITDVQLASDTAYVFRAKMLINGDAYFTRDRLVDPTPEGEYGTKKC